MEYERDSSWQDTQCPFGHQCFGTEDGHGDDWESSLKCQDEWAFLEWHEAPVRRARAFGKNRHVDSALHDFAGFLHALDGGFAVLAVHRNHGGHAHGSGENGNAKDFFFHQDRSPAGDGWDDDGWIEVRNM